MWGLQPNQDFSAASFWQLFPCLPQERDAAAGFASDDGEGSAPEGSTSSGSESLIKKVVWKK